MPCASEIKRERRRELKKMTLTGSIVASVEGSERREASLDDGIGDLSAGAVYHCQHWTLRKAHNEQNSREYNSTPQ